MGARFQKPVAQSRARGGHSQRCCLHSRSQHSASVRCSRWTGPKSLSRSVQSLCESKESPQGEGRSAQARQHLKEGGNKAGWSDALAANCKAWVRGDEPQQLV